MGNKHHQKAVKAVEAKPHKKTSLVVESTNAAVKNVKSAKKSAPVSSSESESSSSESESSSSDSSGSDSEADDSASSDEETNVAAVELKKKIQASESFSSESSDSDSESDSSESASEAEEMSKVVPPVSKKSKPADDSSDSSSSESDSDSSESASDAEETEMKVDMKVAVKKDESDEAESDASSDASDSDDESSSSSEADGSSSSSSEEESDVEEKENVPSKKRKADEDMNAETENRKKQNVEGGDDEPTGVRFSNLAWSVTKDSLEAYILEVGVTPSNVRLIMDRESGRSKGFGFADFASKAEANKAIEAFNEQDLEGRPCRAEISSGQSFTKPAGFGNTQNKFAAKPKSEPTSTLFVGNMSFSSTEDSLYSAFSEQGKVIGVRIPTDKETGRLKGFAYVEFSSVDDAKAALESLDGAPVDGRAIRLDFASVRPANGGSGDRDGARRGGRGGSRGGRGGPRGGGRGGRGGASRTGASAKGAIQQFSGNKMTFDD